MYKILKKYMKEYFKREYTEKDKTFLFYLYYANIRTHVKHKLYSTKDGFYCSAQLICGESFEDDEEYITISYDSPIYTLAKINNNLENGCVDLDEETGEVTFCIDFKPDVPFSEYTEHYYMDNLGKLVYYGQDVMDEQVGKLIYKTFIEWWLE